MKVKVYSNSKRIQITGEFEGNAALQLGRHYALNSSFMTEITLEYGTTKEVYHNGNLIKSHDTKKAQEAAEFIAKYSDYSPHSLADKDNLAKAYKQAAMALHPDQANDDGEKFLKLQKAKEILEKF